VERTGEHRDTSEKGPLLLTLLEAALLGAIQGIFMFVPVSSTSHLALAQHWLIGRGSAIPAPASPELILFDLVVHVGTMVSVAVVFRRSLGRLLRGAWEDLSRPAGEGRGGRRRYLRLVGLGLLASATTGVLGLAVRALGTGVFDLPLAIAALLTVTGIVLWWTDGLGPRWRGLDQLTWQVAVVIGAVQGLALLPGLSRSGVTIAVALALGLRRRWAAEFSFFIAIPTIIGGSLLQTVLMRRGAESAAMVDPLALTVGFTVAAVVGIGALLGVLTLLYRAKFRYFSYYVWALAAAIGLGAVQPA
jgi:undecaprenyl-diphosphatase